jgi:hypothetical protein
MAKNNMTVVTRGKRRGRMIEESLYKHGKFHNSSALLEQEGGVTSCRSRESTSLLAYYDLS